MLCPRCQQENPPKAKFCNVCGARLEVVCPACGHTNAPGSRFCNECGQALADVPVSVPTMRYASPQAFTPHHRR